MAAAEVVGSRSMTELEDAPHASKLVCAQVPSNGGSSMKSQNGSKSAYNTAQQYGNTYRTSEHPAPALCRHGDQKSYCERLNW